MWFIPTRNRPDAMRAVIASMKEAGEVPACAVMVDGPAYDIEWPVHWHIHQSDEHLEMQLALNMLFRLYPNEPSYGVLTDTSRPQSEHWASRMEAAAGSNLIAMADTTRNRRNPRTNNWRVTSYCMGGDLARSLGWVWLDTVVHLYGDDAIEDIAYELGIMRYLPDVVILALLKKEGEVPVDENHKRFWRGRPYIEQDRQAYIAWRRNKFPALIARLKEATCLSA